MVKKYVDGRVFSVYESIRRINSRHLSKIYDCEGNGKQAIIIEEYVSGLTLEEYMEERPIFTEEEICCRMCELLEILSEVHKSGIIHRDITPANILISGDGVLKLVDFGIARERKEEQKKDTTILGTVGYAAPEQFGFQQTDERSDIYAVGVLLNKFLTGKLPDEEVCKRAPYRKIIEKCTEMDARARYQSVEELKLELEKCGGKDQGEERRGGFSLRWLPGFRTETVWKNVMAAVIYTGMPLSAFGSMKDCLSDWRAVVLEGAALCIYLWIAGLMAANVGYWDQKVWPIRTLPRAARITIRVLLWMVLFYFGITLENYVRYEMLNLPRPS